MAAEVQKGWLPTRKWLAAQVVSYGALVVALIQNEWAFSASLQIMAVGLVVQSLTTYLLPNASTPGGVPDAKTVTPDTIQRGTA